MDGSTADTLLDSAAFRTRTGDNCLSGSRSLTVVLLDACLAYCTDKEVSKEHTGPQSAEA